MTKSRFAPPFHGSHYAGTSYVFHWLDCGFLLFSNFLLYRA